jgi:hypothetical protein
MYTCMNQGRGKTILHCTQTKTEIQMFGPHELTKDEVTHLKLSVSGKFSSIFYALKEPWPDLILRPISSNPEESP